MFCIFNIMVPLMNSRVYILLLNCPCYYHNHITLGFFPGLTTLLNMKFVISFYFINYNFTPFECSLNQYIT